MKDNIYSAKATFDTARAICHIHDAGQKNYHVYFATLHYPKMIEQQFRKISKFAKEIDQEYPGIISCRDLADSRSNKPIIDLQSHFHLIMIFVDHPEVSTLIDFSKETLGGWFKEFVRETSLNNTIQYATKLDGYDRKSGSIITTKTYPFDYLPPKKQRKYMIDNIERYVSLLRIENFIERRYL